MKKYKHLDIFERETLSQLLLRGGSLTDIAKIMGRDKSTIFREISKIGKGHFICGFMHIQHTVNILQEQNLIRDLR